MSETGRNGKGETTPLRWLDRKEIARGEDINWILDITITRSPLANWPSNTSTGNKFEKATSWSNNVKPINTRISFLQRFSVDLVLPIIQRWLRHSPWPQGAYSSIWEIRHLHKCYKNLKHTKIKERHLNKHTISIQREETSIWSEIGKGFMEEAFESDFERSPNILKKKTNKPKYGRPWYLSPCVDCLPNSLLFWKSQLPSLKTDNAR